MRWAAGDFMVLQGSAWYGKNTFPLLGNILQAPAYSSDPATIRCSATSAGAANSYCGDIFGYGAWGQVGFNVSKVVSLWYTFGVDHPLYSNILANYRAGGTTSTRLRNINQVGMLRFASGGYAFGLEYYYSRTTDLRYVDPLVGNQVSLTANYAF
jgi:hypothetical protein